MFGSESISCSSSLSSLLSLFRLGDGLVVELELDLSERFDMSFKSELRILYTTRCKSTSRVVFKARCGFSQL